MNEASQFITQEQKLLTCIAKWTGNRYIGDDCAILPGSILVTSDTLVEGTHFLTSLIDYSSLGWKSVAVNLSDIAAMAGKPKYLVVNLTLPANFNDAYFRQIYTAMHDCAQNYKTEIIGGDLTCGPNIVITITVIGEVHEGGCLKRSGAKAGDVVIVSGNFGASSAGLWSLMNGQDQFVYLKEAHVRPKPRLTEAWSLVKQVGSRGALIDASDGLADALIQIARLSKVDIEINPSDIPIHEDTIKAAQIAKKDPFDWALYGGEDYELVATISANNWDILKRLKPNCFTAIGQVGQGTGIVNAKGIGPLNLSKCFQHWTIN